MLDGKRLQEVKEEITCAAERPLEFPLAHIAKELLAAYEQAQNNLATYSDIAKRYQATIEKLQAELARWRVPPRRV